MTKLPDALVVEGEQFSVEWRSTKAALLVCRSTDVVSLVVCEIRREFDNEVLGECVGRYRFLHHAIDCAATVSGRKPSYERSSHRPKDPSAVPLFLRRKQRSH